VNGDGAGQHYATVLGFTNSNDVACSLPRVIDVIGVRSGGSDGTVAAVPGGFFPIGGAADTVAPADRVELVLTTTALDLCQPTTPVPISEVEVALSDGSVTQISVSIDPGAGSGSVSWAAGSEQRTTLRRFPVELR